MNRAHKLIRIRNQDLQNRRRGRLLAHQLKAKLGLALESNNFAPPKPKDSLPKPKDHRSFSYLVTAYCRATFQDRIRVPVPHMSNDQEDFLISPLQNW